jgi:hypothetical protein
LEWPHLDDTTGKHHFQRKIEDEILESSLFFHAAFYLQALTLLAILFFERKNEKLVDRHGLI